MNNAGQCTTFNANGTTMDAEQCALEVVKVVIMALSAFKLLECLGSTY